MKLLPFYAVGGLFLLLLERLLQLTLYSTTIQTPKTFKNEDIKLIEVPYLVNLRHLDSNKHQHYDDNMRTTVTIDDDIARELRQRAKRSEKSFKEVLNESLRLAFSESRSSTRRMKKFRVRPHRSAFRSGIDVGKLNQLADQLGVEGRVRAFRKMK